MTQKSSSSDWFSWLLGQLALLALQMLLVHLITRLFRGK